jgi:oligopeptide/dipeptide ABC transporter ATP-binding protein
VNAAETLLSARRLRVIYPNRRGAWWRPNADVTALRDVDIDIYPGETLALVGESGSGKTTLARALVRCLDSSSGQIVFRGEDVTHLQGRALRPLRRQMQMIFQDPFSSLNPRHSIGTAVAEPLVVHALARGAELRSRVAECLSLVGLDASAARRRPHEFSGGQRQRICVARALACGPSFIAADEPLSALDLSLQQQMLDLFEDLKRRFALTYLFISHDLGVVRRTSDRVAVMYLGSLVEIAATDVLYEQPRHPYSHALLAAAPLADPLLERQRAYAPLAGEPPSPARPPPGCAFHTRCPRAAERCRHERPLLRELTPGHTVACHYPN